MAERPAHQALEVVLAIGVDDAVRFAPPRAATVVRGSGPSTSGARARTDGDVSG